MTKKLLLMAVMAAIGAFVAKKYLATASDDLGGPAGVGQRVPAETHTPAPALAQAHAVRTLEVRTELPADSGPDSEPGSDAQDERHALRPSPVPREEHPQWTPSTEHTSTGKHEAGQPDDEGADD